MGFNINENITTVLSYKDVVLIAAAMGVYIKKMEEMDSKSRKEMVQHAKKLIDKLGYELYDCPQDELNGH